MQEIPAYIDLHCDTVLFCDEQVAGRFGMQPFNLQANPLQIDAQKLQQANCLAQFFAIFCDSRMAGQPGGVMAEFDRLYATLQAQLAACAESLVPAYSYQDILKNRSQGKNSAVLAIEDGGVVDSVEKVKFFRDKGIRYITLVWNYASGLGHPSETDNAGYAACGLTETGRDVVREMQRLGMIVDISHSNERTADDVLDMATRPVIASHSCSQSVFAHQRNIPDRLVRRVAENGGAIGMAYFPEFIHADGNQPVEFAVIKRHLDRLIKVGGEDVTALGSDFDGYMPVEGCAMASSLDVPRFGGYLLENGYSYSRVEKLFQGNALRVIKENMG